MIEDFLQRKLAGLLDQFIEFEKLMLITAEGMTIKNSTIKPKLTQLISQILKIPLDLISGSISSLTLNKPWEKLFFVNSPITIAIQNVYIKAKLPSQVKEQYLLKKKQKLIDILTQGLFNPLDVTIDQKNSFINKKLKEYFLSTIVLQIKSICFQIEIDLKQKVSLLLRISSLTLRKEEKLINQSEKISLDIRGLGVFYKASGEKEVEFIIPTNIQFQRTKTQKGFQKKRTSIKKLLVQKLHFNINNINYGDIARILYVIKWHNSFDHLPYDIWKVKPFVLNECKPKHKFVYCAHLCLSKIKQQHIRKQLIIRRQYINLYEKLLTDPSSFCPENKSCLQELEKQMPIWKITAYRFFCINVYKNKLLAKKQKKKAQEVQSNQNEKQWGIMSLDWFKNWSASQNNKSELQEEFLKKINTIQLVPDDFESIIYVSVEKIKLKLSIVTQFAVEPFISLVGTDCSFKRTQFLLQKAWDIQLQIIRCKIQYEKYLGHCQRYRNFISQCREHLNISNVLQASNNKIEEEEDQFEQIGKFFEASFRHNSKVIQINLLPFDIFINHEVIQKFSILLNIQKLSKLSWMDKAEQTYIDTNNPWEIIQKEREEIIRIKRSQSIQSSQSSPSKKQSFSQSEDYSLYSEKSQQIPKNIEHKQILVKTSFNIIVPINLRGTNCPELVVQVGDFSFYKMGLKKSIHLKAIVIKHKMPEKQDEDEQGYKHLVNYLAPRMIQRVIVRKFNIALSLEKHDDFDQTSAIIDPIHIQIPPQQFLFSLIELIYQHIPKNSQSRVKQYYRRKQSIGQQFIDACQNLKEHITKSMISSSDKLSRRSIIREKRLRQMKATIKGISITQKDFQLLIGQVVAYYTQINISKKSLSSHNEKQIKLSVHNARKLIETINNVKLHMTKQSIKRGFNAQKQKLPSVLDIQISQVNFQGIVLLKHIYADDSPQLNVSIKDFSCDKSIQMGLTQMKASLSLFYDEEIANSQRFNKIPAIEPCELYYRQKNDFNLNLRTIKIDQISINIKPSLFTFLAKAIKYYNIDEQTKCSITNGTINTIKIKKSHHNFYNEYKHNQQFETDNYYCQMLLFGIKSQLEFNPIRQDIPKTKVQCINISQNNFLINRQISPNKFVLQSNIRIVNHQDKTLWLKITSNSSSLRNPEYQSMRIQLRQLSHTPKAPAEVDLTQRVEMTDDWRLGGNFVKSKINRSSLYGQNQKLKQSSSVGKTFSVSLKPKEKVHILIDSNDHKFLQIYDQGVIFTQISMSELFHEKQIVLKGEGEDQDSYLVIRAQIIEKEDMEGPIYHFHVYSPIYIVNKTPWELGYRLSEQQFPYQGNEEDNRKIGRRRSFELIPLKKIPILSSQKVRNTHYNQIQTMSLQLNKCQRQINRFLGLISSLKEKNKLDDTKNQFIKQNKLITLQQNRKEIQLILALQLSLNILKIKIYPQFIFVNMTKEIITFKIKQDQITYPTITLSRQKIDIQQEQLKKHEKSYEKQFSKSKNKEARHHKQKQPKSQRQKKDQLATHISEYINLSDQKLKQREALKQLFQNFSNSLEIFTGKIQEQRVQRPKINRKMMYNPTNRHVGNTSGSSSLAKSSGKGYRSDYNSDGQFRQQMIDNIEQNLEEENIMVYSEERYMFYKRVLRIQGYFRLIFICPTVHIINKSQVVFFAKSSCEQLVKINKNSHSYIHISQQSVDLQASFQEEIGLNEWMRMDLTHLGTVYYSKDMIQHHGSGYQSKEYTFRRKRMKKTPKIFYRILLCKYQRGQKILIQQSQYPPYTFINNTNHRIKIEQTEQHFIEEFPNKGDMGEYAPKNPYHSPKFTLSIVKQYQYKKLLEFGVQKKQDYVLDNGIIVSVQQYKDKTIVQVKNSIQEQKKQDAENNFELDQTQKTIIEVGKTSITVLNNWNRQLNTNYIEKILMTHEKKNYKDYYRFEISNTQGYDYMDCEPNYIYKRQKKEKKRLAILQRENNQYQPFMLFQLIINYHKNAFVVEKCSLKLDQIVFYISADLILAYVQNYYEPIHTLMKVYHYFRGHHHEKKSDFGNKTFIFESLEWQGTTLKVQTRNLSIMQTFLNKQYQKWLVKFINWLGDFKPIVIDPLRLTYQQITISKLRRYINLRKKAAEVAQQMMDYPLGQLKEVIAFLFGDQRKTIRQKIGLFYNFFKSVQYILNFAWSLNENLKSKLKTYNEIFSQNYKQELNVLNKMIAFEYCQWKYKKDHHPTSKLQRKIKRLEKYNTRYSILSYDEFKANIKLAIDSHLQNKLFKKIEHIYRINEDYIFAIVQQYAIIYCLSNNTWNVMQAECVISFHLQEGELSINFWEEGQEKEKQFNNIEFKKSNIRAMIFKDAELNEQKVTKIKQLLQENKLTHYY